VRKEVIQYQLANATTDAEKTYIEDMARLNGFDPDTGERLKYPKGDKELPNYFELDRYKWKELDNDSSLELFAGFNHWRDELPEKYADWEKDRLIDKFIMSKDPRSERPDGKTWNQTAVQDLKNYGKDTQETAAYRMYKSVMAPELLWFDDEQHWNTILKEHTDAGRKVE